MKCSYRQILLKMQEQRSQELREYESFLTSAFPSLSDLISSTDPENLSKRKLIESYFGNIEQHEATRNKYISDSIKNRHIILLLELPFETDIVNVNRALESSHIELKEKSIEDVAEELYSVKNARGKLTENSTEKRNSQNHIKKKIKAALPILNVTTFDSEGNSSYTTETSGPEDFESSAVKEAFLNNFVDLQQKGSSKKVQESLAKRIIRCLTIHKNFMFSTKKVISKGILSDYFMHLENRCLKSHSDKPYRDLVEIRLRFYIPSLSTKKLQQITRQHIDKENKVIKFNNSLFPISETFIELIESIYSEKEFLFKRNAKEFDKFLLQTSTAKAANLKIRLTASLLKCSLEDICNQEHYYKEHLPRR